MELELKWIVYPPDYDPGISTWDTFDSLEDALERFHLLGKDCQLYCETMLCWPCGCSESDLIYIATCDAELHHAHV